MKIMREMKKIACVNIQVIEQASQFLENALLPMKLEVHKHGSIKVTVDMPLMLAQTEIDFCTIGVECLFAK